MLFGDREAELADEILPAGPLLAPRWVCFFCFLRAIVVDLWWWKYSSGSEKLRADYFLRAEKSEKLWMCLDKIQLRAVHN